MLIGIIPTRAIYFYSYAFSKKSLHDIKIGNNIIGDSPFNHLTSAFFAGVASNTIMNPLWMVKTRYQLFVKTVSGAAQAPPTYMSIINTIWKEEGIRGFYRGLSASYIGCIEGGAQWVIYENLKKRIKLLKHGSSDQVISPAEMFLAAGASKFAAIVATYPHEVVRIRLREGAAGGAYKYTGFFNTLKKIYVEEGYRGLYGGMGIHLARSVPNAAILFLSWELSKTLIASSSTPAIIEVKK